MYRNAILACLYGYLGHVAEATPLIIVLHLILLINTRYYFFDSCIILFVQSHGLSLSIGC